MLDLPLREVKEKALGVIEAIVPPFVTPNHITTLSFVCGIFCCYYLSVANYTAGAWLWAFNRLFDGIDGKANCIQN